ncbi:MAG: GDSL-type esterase/lipase family protein [Clostridium sp.]|nr:GDSL-type esterase/lipase family protein [Clostridium sp.]MCM1547064.1 GDSL-type esterase/lipase family protein [Ruminococcus sp.]
MKSFISRIYSAAVCIGAAVSFTASAYAEAIISPNYQIHGNTISFPTSEFLGDTNLNNTLDIEDIELLQKYILRSNTLSKQQIKLGDLNKDGNVNVYDAVLLKRIFINESGSAEEGELSDTMWKASSENVKLIGRNLIKDDITWLLQSGSAAEFTVAGQSAELVLSGDAGIDADPDFRPRYAVYVDDELLTDETIGSAEKKISLFESTASVTKKVKVIMLSEAMYGGIGINTINVSSTLEKPVKPTAKKDLSIEFIGDSITCAYGVEGSGSYESFKTTTENFTKSYAYLTAQKLDADYSAVCYSGHGIVSGYTSDGDKNSDSLIPDYYEMASKIKGYDTAWDFTLQKHDAVVINLGTNDINYVNADKETRSEEFVNGYVDFLKTVRKYNSDAAIICTVGTMGADLYDLVAEAAAQYTAETGDERVSSYKSATHTQADGLGSDWHPSAATQQNSAYVLSDKICQTIGMESDQVGLDVASDAVYSIDIKSDSGANAAEYFSEYDKSYWINMVTGGTSPDDITANVSGINLKKGGEYRLEFELTASADGDIGFSVSGNDTYFSDTVSVSGTEAAKYSKTFTVDSNDDSAAISFNIGGKNSYNVTLKSLKLVKIK